MFQGSNTTFTKRNPLRVLNTHNTKAYKGKGIRALKNLTVHDLFSETEVLEKQGKNEERDFCYAHVT